MAHETLVLSAKDHRAKSRTLARKARVAFESLTNKTGEYGEGLRRLAEAHERCARVWDDVLRAALAPAKPEAGGENETGGGA